MKCNTPATVTAAFLAGAVVSLVLSGGFEGDRSPLPWTVHAQEAAPKQDVDLAALRAEVERLKNVVPDQAHAMSDLDYHFNNLWFAGKAVSWPLAEFYWKETYLRPRIPEHPASGMINFDPHAAWPK